MLVDYHILAGMAVDLDKYFSRTFPPFIRECESVDFRHDFIIYEFHRSRSNGNFKENKEPSDSQRMSCVYLE